jgi:hypothetical protein
MLQSPKYIRKLSQPVGVLDGTANTLKKKHFCLHPYKITTVHELKPGDSAKQRVMQVVFRLSWP